MVSCSLEPNSDRKCAIRFLLFYICSLYLSCFSLFDFDVLSNNQWAEVLLIMLTSGKQWLSILTLIIKRKRLQSTATSTCDVDFFPESSSHRFWGLDGKSYHLFRLSYGNEVSGLRGAVCMKVLHSVIWPPKLDCSVKREWTQFTFPKI